jgi:hypothetical protein
MMACQNRMKGLALASAECIKNWKTTVPGVGVLVLIGLKAFGPRFGVEFENTDLIMAVGALGLIFAGDATKVKAL